MLLVLPPDKPAREAILRFHLRERPVDKIDLGAMAKQTEGFSGADLAHLCESAAELAMNESMRLKEPRPIRMDDFNQALHKLRPSARAWFETARNFALFANEGGIYDELLEYLKRERLL
jgi:SpoVK/Ycf46/Vps4 family AAA+-type ATPase